ncbi:MAG TPA: dTDP-4-dehydrorhamnose 3,5-epimerase [Pyrinomonadaceae bacterium]|nr:dTDP-4-dehydrorhamnose 3,5-epimerase [Pyrinomonadaceae bacterium]
MKFSQTTLPGAYLIEIEPHEDERGYFARTWCREEFLKYKLNATIAQCSISYNKRRGTLRGVHYQIKPYEEAKVVACTAGAIYDLIVDLRPESETFKRWFAVELSADKKNMLYVPEGVAHGFQTLEDDSEAFYQISEVYQPEYSRGIRFDDPAFGFQWPIAERIISERDRAFPDFTL